MTDDAPSRSLLERLKVTANEYGQPNAETDGDLVCAYVEEFYELPGNGAGGLLHIVLDDGNTEMACVEFCRDAARKAGDEVAFWLAQLLLTFTDDEREMLLGLPYCGSCCTAEQAVTIHRAAVRRRSRP